VFRDEVKKLVEVAVENFGKLHIVRLSFLVECLFD